MEEDFPRKREMHKKEKSEKVENVTKKKNRDKLEETRIVYI